MKIEELWRSRDPNSWNVALANYWTLVKPKNLALERSLDTLALARVKSFSQDEWLRFLLDEYFVWKYTAPNRYATTTRKLQDYASAGMTGDLNSTRMSLLNFPPEKIKYGLVIALRIPGLGVAGASGLLSLMYPKYYATVDQFVVLGLQRVSGLKQASAIAKMRPENLSLNDGVVLIELLAAKAAGLNELPEFADWTPRKIDMVLWACRE